MGDSHRFAGGPALIGLTAVGMLAGALGLTLSQPGHPPPLRAAEESAAAPAALPPNVAPGWKIRVCSEQTTADSLRFRFYPASDAHRQDPYEAETVPGQQTAAWVRGDSTLIRLPRGMARADRITVEAIPTQNDRKASVCLLYGDHVAKRMEFDDMETSTIRNTQNGTCGC